MGRGPHNLFLPIPTPASQPAQPGGRAVTGVGSQFVRKRRARLPRFQKPEKVGPGRRKLLLPGVLSSISHRRNGGRRQAPPPGRCAPRWVKAPTARRVRTAGGLAPRPHAARLPCAKADGTTCPPPPQKDKDRLSPVFVSPLGNWKQEKDMVSSPRRGRAVAGKRRPSPGPSGPGRGAPGGGGRSP